MSTVIQVQHLHKRFGDRVALEDVSFSIVEGEVFGLLGPAGSGKTTVLECLLGLRGRDGGSVRVLGRDPRRERAETTKWLGRQLEDARLLHRPQTADALALYGSFYADPAAWPTVMDALGDGKRLAAALSAAGRPQVAVFDDLTTGLAAEARRQTWEMVESVRDSGTTVLLATTSLDEAAELCDRVALLDHGHVAMIGSPATLALTANDCS
jgi:ABC-2 type transport system ATP-binding protein